MTTLTRGVVAVTPAHQVSGHWHPGQLEPQGNGTTAPSHAATNADGVSLFTDDPQEKGAFLAAAVAAIRRHLGMEVALTPGANAMTAPDSGARIRVPILLGDGSVYGTLCSYGSRTDLSPADRDLGLLRIFADMAAERIERERKKTKARYEATQRIRSLIRGKRLSIVFQPIFDLRSHAVVGFEALSRITAEPTRSPDVWFNEAAAVGLAAELEFKVIRQARADFEHAPAGCYLSLNISPMTLLTGRVEEVLAEAGWQNLQIEVTEHESIEDYGAILKVLSPLREKGVRIAVDDFGSGYASFRHVLGLSPTVMKLDMDIVRDIDSHPPRRAVAAALVAFAREIGGNIVAEGVETAAEVAVLRNLGVTQAQGYYLGKPGPLPG